MEKPIIYKMKDATDSFKNIKPSLICDPPLRTIICGASGTGKTSILACMLCLPNWYLDDYEPENIWIFSGSRGDQKIDMIMKRLKIPYENLINDIENMEEIGNAIYEESIDTFNELKDENEKPPNILMIFDDVAYTNKLAKSKKSSFFDKLVSNGRKYLISSIVICQKLTQLSSNIRLQCNNCFIFQTNKKQLDLLEADFNYKKSKKEFYEMFYDNVKTNHDFIYINLENEDKYFDKDFKAIKN